MAQGVRFTKESAQRIAKAVRRVEGGVTDLTPQRRKGHKAQPAGGSDYSDFAFGFSLDAAVDSVNAGYVIHGTGSPGSIAGADIAIAADQTYVYVTFVLSGSGTTQINSSIIIPKHTATKLNWLLHKVTLTDGVASVEEGDVYHVGNINIPGVFAP